MELVACLDTANDGQTRFYVVGDPRRLIQRKPPAPVARHHVGVRLVHNESVWISVPHRLEQPDISADRGAAEANGGIVLDLARHEDHRLAARLPARRLARFDIIFGDPVTDDELAYFPGAGLFLVGKSNFAQNDFEVGRLARIDTGISRYYNGPVSWLEILGERMIPHSVRRSGQ